MDTIFEGNNCSFNQNHGLIFDRTMRGAIIGSYFVNNLHDGISLYDAGGINIERNYVAFNKRNGICLLLSWMNVIWNNIFQHNLESQAKINFGCHDNSWDYDQYGNYWSDFTDRYPNATKSIDGQLWNVSYYINPDNDHFPLVNPSFIETGVKLKISGFPLLILYSFEILGILFGVLKKKEMQ